MVGYRSIRSTTVSMTRLTELDGGNAEVVWGATESFLLAVASSPDQINEKSADNLEFLSFYLSALEYRRIQGHQQQVHR